MAYFKILKSTPFQLALAIALSVVIQPFLSVNTLGIFYSISLVIKDSLMLILPFVIFFYLASSLQGFKGAAPLMVLSLFVFVVLSNGLTVLTSYGVGLLTLDALCCQAVIAIKQNHDSLPVLFSFPLKPLIENQWALLFGILVGLVFSMVSVRETIRNFIQVGKNTVTVILKKGFIPVLPLYVFGFMLKMMHDGSLSQLAYSYGKVFMLSCSLIVVYIFVLYFIGSGFSFKRTLKSIQTMLPAGFTGLSTMSGTLTMPVTLEATEKNIGDTAYANFVIPATVNPHMVGDGLNISLTALYLLVISGHDLPSFGVYLVFMLHYCFVKFSAAGVPGGGVLVIFPVVEKYLGLSSEMSSILATIYILQDSLMTASNVMANGAFAMITHRVFKCFGWINAPQKLESV